ncbi:MAG: sensor histidine kinase [Saprospiraceae bacterium]
METTPIHLFSRMPDARRVHLFIWITLYCLLLLYSMHKWDKFWFAIINPSIAITSYLLAAYSNFLWLMPRWFTAGNLTRYLIISGLCIFTVGLLRMLAEYYILFPIHLAFYNFSTGHIALVTITVTLAYIFGGLMYITTDYIVVLKKQEALQRRQVITELALLKSQVQPHFLFNTLNNLYYLAYKKSEKTPQVIAKLSEIMRYFIEEAPKEKVLLATELDFIKNYIDLESIRMLNPPQLDFSEEISDNQILIPPMLLIPLVENIFKHGLDKMQTCNEVYLHLQVNNTTLLFSVKNKLYHESAPKKNGGIENLRQRLQLLYTDQFYLDTKAESGYYIAVLKIPI